MRIGVVSDTHNHLRNVRRIVDLFNAAAVDRVVHASRRFGIRLAVVLHGHTHRPVYERRAGDLVFNPGECAGMLAGHNTVGVLDLSSLEAEWLRF